MGDVLTTSIAGWLTRGFRRGSTANDGVDQYVIPVKDRAVLWNGKATTFQSAGRATSSQKLLTIQNVTGSSIIASVERVKVDLLSTVVKAVTVIPPVIRLSKFTATPTGGTACTKVARDSAQGTSSSSIIVLQDQSGDSAASATAAAGTALAATITASWDQIWAPRMLTAVGYETSDIAQFLGSDNGIVLRAGEGLAVEIFATTAANNPVTDKWVTTIDWEEYTRP